jgi:hypothetical protein
MQPSCRYVFSRSRRVCGRRFLLEEETEAGYCAEHLYTEETNREKTEARQAKEVLRQLQRDRERLFREYESQQRTKDVEIQQATVALKRKEALERYSAAREASSLKRRQLPSSPALEPIT